MISFWPRMNSNFGRYKHSAEPSAKTSTTVCSQKTAQQALQHAPPRNDTQQIRSATTT